VIKGGILPFLFRASLGTPISRGISIFPWENELISLGKMKIPWKIGVFLLRMITRNSRLKTQEND
jgi:hypothetical protein